MTEQTNENTKQSSATPLELPELKAINYADTFAQLVKQMKWRGINCTIERRQGGGINVVVYGVNIGDDGKFEEVSND